MGTESGLPTRLDLFINDFLKEDSLQEFFDYINQIWRVKEIQKLDDVISTQLIHVCFVEEGSLIKQWPLDKIELIYKKIEVVFQKWLAVTYYNNPEFIGDKWDPLLEKLKQDRNIH